MSDLPISAPIDYTARDYASIRQQMIDRIQEVLPEWTSRSSSDFGIVLIELFSWAMDLHSFMEDRIVNETFLTTATLRESVLGIAEMLGYVPVPPTPAVARVTFRITSVNAVTIPAGTKVTSPESSADGSELILFETDADLTITPPTMTGEVEVTQGETVVEVVALSDGTVNQSYALFRPGVFYQSVLIDVDPGDGFARWTEVSDLAVVSPGDWVYAVKIDVDGIARVYFGDGATGKVPTPGSVIRATYRIGVGASGNVPAGAINQLYDSVEGLVGVTNVAAATGGEDAESLETIRKSAPKSLTAMNRAVTAADYAALVRNVGGVEKSNATAEIYTNVSLYIAPTSGVGQLMQDDLKTRIQEYFLTRKMVNTTITLIDATYIGINIAIDLQVLDNHYRETVKLAVENAISEVLSFSQRDFAEKVTLSMIYHAIYGLTGVDYVVITRMTREDAYPQTGTTTITTEAGEIPVLATNETQAVTLTAGTTGGDFTLTWAGVGDEETDVIAWDATAAELKDAMVTAGFGTTDDFRVVSPEAGVWLITFMGVYAGVNVAEFGAETPGNLTGTLPGVGVVTQSKGVIVTASGGITT